MTEPLTDPYTILGLARTATDEEIKGAYFAQVRQHPPEREPQAFKRIRAAYDRLRDPAKRIDVDMRLLESWPEPARGPRLPEPDLAIHAEDVLTLLKTDSDLARRDWHTEFREVHL